MSLFMVQLIGCFLMGFATYALVSWMARTADKRRARLNMEAWRDRR